MSAILHTGYPVRHWDHDLGPGQPHLFGRRRRRRDLTPDPGGALREADFDVSADGTLRGHRWSSPAPGAALHVELVRIDADTGERTAIAEDPGADLGSPAISPDGTRWPSLRESNSTPERRRESRCAACASARRRWSWRRLGPLADVGDVVRRRRTLIVTADEDGRGPVFAVDPGTAAVTRLTARRFHLHRCAGRARRGDVRAAQFLCCAAAPGAHRSRRFRHGVALRPSCPSCPGMSKR